jgi:hypothetical protein
MSADQDVLHAFALEPRQQLEERVLVHRSGRPVELTCCGQRLLVIQRVQECVCASHNTPRSWAAGPRQHRVQRKSTAVGQDRVWLKLVAITVSDDSCHGPIVMGRLSRCQ